METNEAKLMLQLEKEVTTLNKDVLKVKEQVGGVQREMGEISSNVREILKILSGNEAVRGDIGITGRLFDAEVRIRDIEMWKLEHANAVVSDYKNMKRRIEVLEKRDQKNKITIGVWCGVATGLSLILQFVLKYIYHL